MSSLAAQLAQNASLNAALLVDRSRRKWSESYLFTGREADQHDLESIHALGVNGLLQLASLQPALRKFTENLFSEHAKMTDRTLLSSEANVELNASIDGFLTLLGPYLLDAPAGKVLEWLVRRFRVNEFNIEAILTLFLPYHESPHFTKMLSILHIKPNTTWSFLLPFKSATQNLPRVSLVTEMLKNMDAARFVTSLLPNAIKGGHAHRTLLAFNAACLHDFLLRSPQLDEGTVAYLLPALLEPLGQTYVVKDAVLGSYILLSAFSQKCKITPAALNAIISAMAVCVDQVSAKHFTSTALSVLEPQVELEFISEESLKVILGIHNLGHELQLASGWMGSEKLLNPLLPGLVKRLTDQDVVSVFEAIITAPKTALVVVQRSAILLIDIILSADVPSGSSRRLLAVIQQRHPSAFHHAIDEASQRDGAEIEALEQLRISLSVVQGIDETTGVDDKGALDMVLASTNSDAAVRMSAVNLLLDTLVQKAEFPAPEKASISTALLARVQDTDQAVVDALYSNPSIILPVLSNHAEAYIDHLAAVLSVPGSKAKRTLVRVHVTFLVSHYIAGNPAYAEAVFQRIIFPFLLFSKPRQHTADVVWDIISQEDPALFEWLAGCATIIRTEKDKEGANVVEMMSHLNIALSSQISRNILRSNDYSLHFDALLAKLQDPNPHTKVLGYLIMRSLLGQLSGEHQVDAARRVLDLECFKELRNVDELLSGDETISEALSDAAIGKIIAVKPRSRTTVYWLQVAILSVVSSISRPGGLVTNWLSDSSSDASDKRSLRYIEVFRTIYRLANLPTSAPRLTASILQTLFANLKDDALAFLAGIWVGSSPAISEESELRTVALYHAAAFLRAHQAEERTIDFQTILPALLVALQSHDPDRRQIALTCVSSLHQLTDHKFTTVYGFDTIYGKRTSHVQYLDQDDFKKYLSNLMEHEDHILHDAEYVQVFHRQHLGRKKSDRKRELEYKHRVLCFYASHINALTISVAQAALLKMLAGVSDSVKVQNMLPTIKLILATPAVALNPAKSELMVLLTSCFDSSAASDLNEADGETWDIYTSVLRYAFAPGALPTLSHVASRALEQGLFTGLNSGRKIALLELLLEFGARNADNYTTCKQLVNNLVGEVTLIVHLLDLLQPATGTPRATKRPKTTAPPEDVLRRFSLFAEVLGSKQLPGSTELVTSLLETLNRLSQSLSAAHADVSYIAQLLMSAIENAASKIKEAPNLSPSTIRLEILVEIIRVADNPQTFHQALLLVADLARLAPESVLHNVMPVFTFMGANVFHRDDGYSFKVVQQTIDSIVPVTVSSLKRAHTQPLELQSSSKEFLKVFTDAANHIPRHRRTNFFIHLVEVLGPEDFLAPICMLLVDKVSTRVIRQSLDDAQTYLTLPSSLLHHYSSSLQLHTLNSVLQECERLIRRIANPECNQAVFLDTSSEETIATAISTLRRRAQALVIFVGHALRPYTPRPNEPHAAEKQIGNLVSTLISLTHFHSGSSPEGRADDIALASRSSLNKVLGVMLASDFIDAVLLMVQSTDLLAQSGALNLLSQRLATVSVGVRQTVLPVMVKIIAAVRDILKSQINEPSALCAFSALKAIFLTLSPGEESSALETIPLLLSAIKARTFAVPATAALSSLPSKLGPRSIPYFREMITQSVGIIREGNPAINDAYSVLHGLVRSIPTFWGSGEVTQVITLFIDQSTSSLGTSEASSSSLVKTITKKVPSNVLLPAMVDMWPSIQSPLQPSRFAAYFQIIAKVLRNGARPTVLEHLRSLFKVFVESFEVIASSENLAAMETPTTIAFKELVVKLNDAAFRPLFRRLYDWAFAGESDDSSRKTTFCHIYITLLDFFKGLMNPYMSFLLEPFIGTFHAFASNSLDNSPYWMGVIETLRKSLTFDDGSFWRDDKLRQLSSPLIKQIPTGVKLNSVEGKASLQDCFDALVDTVTDDLLLKTINLEILMHTRSEDSRLRLFALSCSERLWRVHGSKLLGFATETTTFIAECSEDENDMVVRESFKLKNAVESVAGNINGL